MLENLSDGFSSIIRKIRGQSRLTEENIQETLQLIRTTLIDADVALAVVDEFLAQVKVQAMGQKIISSLSPGQALIGLVQKELIKLMGTEATPIQSPGNDPQAILLCGLQGSGKTTTAAKLALHIKKTRKRIMVVSTDVHRPAAIEQLRTLCEQINIEFHEPQDEDDRLNPVKRAQLAMKAAQQSLCDYVLVDTAGRNVLDENMMQEIKLTAATTSPTETLLVLDATLGQEALTVAAEFDKILSLTGICLTKLDGDARGGAAMSAKAVTGVPIKFIGVGERTEDLQEFIPERMASRILGMGDIVSLVESATEALGKQKTASLERKLRRKKSPGLELSDMIDQLRHAEKLGGLDKITDTLPSSVARKVKQANVDPKIFRRMEAIYLSMTKFERRNPQLIKGERKIRIASGAGVEVQQVNQLLTQHSQANKLMKRMAKNPLAAANLMRGMFN